LKASHHIVGLSAETLGKFNMVFDTVNLQRPTLDAISSGSKDSMNDLMTVVLAVPGPPTNSEDLPTEDTSRSSASKQSLAYTSALFE